MTSFKLLLKVFVSSFILISCGIDNDRLHDCSFKQIDENQDGLIDETEQSLIEECRQNLLTSKSEITNNLVGEWELIGYGDGWSPTKSHPCVFMKVTEDKLILDFEDSNISSVSNHDWEVLEVNISINTPFPISAGTVYFKLSIEPKVSEPIGISGFCENYMYGNAISRDGNMYLFEKVK